MAPRTTPSLDADSPFRWVGGDPALDFVNTVDWTTRGPEHDRFASWARVVEWAEQGGVIAPALGRALRRRGASDPRAAAAALARVRETRAVLQRVLAGSAAGAPSRPALDAFNACLAEVLPHLAVGAPAPGDEPGAAWRWREPERHLEAVLWPVVWAAARLLTGDEASRLRVCGGVDCGWMYVDRSRNGLRRWCEMATCGTREKSRQRAARTRGRRRRRTRRAGTRRSPP